MSSEAERYWDERLRSAWGLQGVGRLGFGRMYNEWQYRLRRDIFGQEVRRLGLSGSRVLDVGSGTGFYLERWRELGAGDIRAVDISGEAVQRLTRSHPWSRPVRLDISDADAVDVLEAGSYDAISAMDVLFHITDDERYERAIANLASLLAPGGVLIATEMLVRGAARHSHHDVARSLARVGALLTHAGLAIERRRPASVLMAYPIDAPPAVGTIWRAAMAPLRIVNALGWLYGPALYAVDRILTGRLQEGPSAELIVCRRVAPERDARGG